MGELMIRLMASVLLAILFSLAAIWGWNTLFGDIKTFAYDVPTVAAVMAISFVFTGTRV